MTSYIPEEFKRFAWLSQDPELISMSNEVDRLIAEDRNAECISVKNRIYDIALNRALDKQCNTSDKKLQEEIASAVEIYMQRKG